MARLDLLPVSHSFCLGTFELSLLDLKEVLYTQLSSMLTSLWHNVCNKACRIECAAFGTACANIQCGVPKHRSWHLTKIKDVHASPPAKLALGNSVEMMQGQAAIMCKSSYIWYQLHQVLNIHVTAAQPGIAAKATILWYSRGVSKRMNWSKHRRQQSSYLPVGRYEIG